MSNTVTVRVARQLEPGAARVWHVFQLSDPAAGSVADLLQQLNRQPKTRDGQRVAPIEWSSQCSWPSCGACTMRINGRAANACATSWKDALGRHKQLILEPLSGFAVLCDLRIDRATLLLDALSLHAVGPADARAEATADTTPAAPSARPEGGRDAPAEPAQAALAALGVCTQCGACHDACPVIAVGTPFAGPAALFENHRAGLLPGAADAQAERLAALRSDRGIHACSFAFACASACPQQLPLADIMTAQSAAAATDALLGRWLRR